MKVKDVLIRKAAEEEDNEYRITDETANTAMAFQPPAISLQYNPHTEISLPYTTQKFGKRKTVKKHLLKPI